jgi:hypothetical protein
VSQQPPITRPTIDRYDHERRFLPSGAELDVFIDAVQTGPLPEANKLHEPSTTTWTTYLDTDERRYLLSGDGATARRLRVREYEGESAEGLVAPCYLELKDSTGPTRSKVRVTAPIAALARFIEGADIEGFFTDPATWTVALRTIREAVGNEHVSPRVGTSYRRRCLASGPALRVTLDEDLTFFYPVSLGAPHDNRAAVARGPARVLEVKYEGALPGWLERACAALKEARDFSKYSSGMLAVRRAASAVELIAATG